MHKVTTTRFKLNGRNVPAGTPGAVREVVHSAKWYARVRGRTIPLHENKATALSMLKKLEADAIAGRLDPGARARRVKLDEPLFKAFEAHLTANGLHPGHIRNQVAGARRVCREVGFRTAEDLIGCGSRVAAWIASERTTAGHRHREHKPKPLAAGSRRRLRASVQGLFVFLVGMGVLPDEARPVIRLPKGGSVGHVALSLDEVARLLEAARMRPAVKAAVITKGKNRGRSHAGLNPAVRKRLEATGRARAILYRFALATAMRGEEIRRLCVRNIDFDNAVVRLDAGATKTRRAAVLPLPGRLVEDLRELVGKKAPGAPLFEMQQYGLRFKQDVQFAGIEANGRGLLTFRCLRTTASTLADQIGASTTVRQAMLRHSTPLLTDTVYLKRNSDSQRVALSGYWEALPG